MIDPKTRNIVAEASALGVIAYNKKLISADRVPNRWEDFLKPEFKGKKFVVDIRPRGFTALVVELGEERVRDYAHKLKEQDPIWSRGDSRALTAIANGEYALHQLVNYHSCMRVKDPTGSLVCKVIEPVSVRLLELEAVPERAEHPFAGLLWLEFQASPTGQRIIDEYEPLKSSVYASGSALETVTKGKKLSVNDWNTFHNTPKWTEMIIKAFGFPKADK
jgi:ABC-type Fe3+ transport system substrate-binding protein